MVAEMRGSSMCPEQIHVFSIFLPSLHLHCMLNYLDSMATPIAFPDDSKRISLATKSAIILLSKSVVNQVS